MIILTYISSIIVILSIIYILILAKLFKKAPITIRAAIINATINAVLVGIFMVLPEIIKCPTEADIRIVDISVLDTQGFPTFLEVKARNIGDNPAFIKRVEFNVDKVYCLKRCELYEAVQISAIYEIELKIVDTSYIVTKNISQNIQGKHSDRFAFSFGTRNFISTLQNIVLFKIKLKLVYNEANKIAKSEYIIFKLIEKWGPRGSFTLDDETIRKNCKYNLSLLEEINRTHAKKSEGVKNLIAQISQIKEYLNKAHMRIE